MKIKILTKLIIACIFACNTYAQHYSKSSVVLPVNHFSNDIPSPTDVIAKPFKTIGAIATMHGIGSMALGYYGYKNSHQSNIFTKRRSAYLMGIGALTAIGGVTMWQIANFKIKRRPVLLAASPLGVNVKYRF